MRNLIRPLSCLLVLALVLGLLPGFASALSISDSGFTKIGDIPNDYVGTQGMCTDGKYIYTFKMPNGNENLARFYRTDISTGKTILMHVTYDTSLTNFLALGHGNDMCAVVHKGVTYLYLATMYHRSHSYFATHSIWKFKVTGDTIEKAAYYDVIEYGTDDMEFTGLTLYKQTDSGVTLLSSDGKYIYTIDLAHDQPSGTVDCQWVFTINYTSPPTPTGAPKYNYQSSSGSTYYGVQGMTYDNGKLYYVMTGSQSSSTAKDNYIFCYDIENFTDKRNVTAIADESIFITSSYYQFFLEFESVDIHNGTMYFSANAGKYGYYEDFDFCGKLKKQFAVTPEHTVTFCDEAGKTLQAVKVKQGQTAVYSGVTPTKAYDTDNHYTFSNWLSSVNGSAARLDNVQGDMTVYAGFTATAHSYQEKITAQPTCTGEGSKTLTCTCGRSYEEAVPAKGHSPEVLNGKAPTCSEEGYTGDTVCSVCEALIASGTAIEKLPHTPVTDKGYAPTCTSTGLSDGSHCQVCGEVLAAQEVLPLAPHREKTVPGKAATCLSSGLTDGAICEDCGMETVRQTVLPRLGHDYSYVNQGQTHLGTCRRCSKTVTAAHSFSDGSCVCGASPLTVDENIRIQHSLNLASDISINYAVSTSQLSQYDSFYLECRIPEYANNVQTGTRTVRVEPRLNGSYYYFTLEGLNAANMNHEVTAVLHMTKGAEAFASKEDVYSIATYAYAQLDKAGSTDSLKALCANLLRYGALTQQYKNYCTNDLPDARLSPSQKALLTDLNKVAFDQANTVLNDVASPMISWEGKALLLDSKVTLRFVINTAAYVGTVSKLSLRVSYLDSEGKEQSAVMSDPGSYQTGTDLYYFDFDGLRAAELRAVVSAAVYLGDTQVSPTLQYSASSYGNGKSGTLLNLCKALMAYSDCAKAYFAS